MAYLKGFQYDVFVSYGHVDKLGMKQEEWVPVFATQLEGCLDKMLGSEAPSVFLDEKDLDRNADFSEKLIASLRGTGVLICIVSPRYAASDWCKREIQEFLRAADANGGHSIGARLRVCRVTKTPVDWALLPDPLQKSIGWQFFRFIDDKAGKFREFPAKDTFVGFQEFCEHVQDAATEICTLLKDMNGVGAELKGTVYLAEATSDVEDVRDQVRRELRERGYRVVPEQDMPRSGSALREFVRGKLAEAVLSVHLAGNAPAMIPEGEEQDIAFIQVDLAGERAKANHGFRRVVWIKPDVKPEGVRQEQFLQYLREEIADLPDRPDVLEGEARNSNVDELKRVILSRLPAPKLAAPEEAPGPRPCRIYVVCEQADRDAVQTLKKTLHSMKFEVKLPLFAEDGSGRDDEFHRELLGWCDAVIIYWGSANERSVAREEINIGKAVGRDRKDLFQVKATYIAQPETAAKKEYDSNELMVVREDGSSALDLLQPLIEALRASR